MSQHALVTGGNGFLGGIIAAQLQQSGYTVTNLSRHPSSQAAINLSVDLAQPFQLPDQRYDLVIHAAGKAHSVPKNEEEAQVFYQVNREGTQHLLDALSQHAGKLPEAFVFISTVAVFGKDKGEHLPEDAPLAAQDPYGLSKIAAEEMVRTWSRQHQVPATILRLPLIAGPEAPGNLGAMVQGIKKGRFFQLAEGKARRSVVLAQDVAEAIPVAAKFPGTYTLTDGQHPSFAELAKVITEVRQYKPPRSLPGVVGMGAGLAGSTLETALRRRMPFSWKTYRKMTQTLTFDDALARKTWDWAPKSVTQHPEFWL
ncbi:MAG: NAD-dependent epimerase/dehydratase family protein [Bacteroidota bacterium]